MPRCTSLLGRGPAARPLSLPAARLIWVPVAMGLACSPAVAQDAPPDPSVATQSAPDHTAAASLPHAILPGSMRIARLDNGLTVIAVPAPTPGIVAVQTWMDVGSRDEVQPGMTGFAHFFEHLMFHGSERLPGDLREARLLELAVDENAWTSEDHTVYVSRAPKASLAKLLEIDIDRFAHLSLTPDGVRREAGAVYGEFRKGRASPDERVYEALRGAAFELHPYGHSTIGLEQDISAMPTGHAQAVAFHQTYYRPQRATVVIAGDIDPGEAIAQVTRTHSGWKGHPAAAPPPPLPEEPPQQGERRVQVDWTEGAVNARVAMGWRIPAFVPGDPDAAALVLLGELLAGQSGAMRKRVVEDDQLAWSVAIPTPRPRSPGLFEIYAEARPGVAPDRLEAVILEEIAALTAPRLATREAGPDPLVEAVRRARSRARRSAVLELDSPASWASAVGEAASFRGEPRDLERDVAALGAVTAADIRRVATRNLVAEGRTVVHLTAAAPSPSPSPLPALPDPDSALDPVPVDGAEAAQ
jgi:zinc protease